MVLLTGPDFLVELANKKARKIWAGNYQEIMGRPIGQIFPELIEQGFQQVMENVYRTGESFTANGIPFSYLHNGTPRNAFFSCTLEALRNHAGEIDSMLVTASEQTNERLTPRTQEENPDDLQNLFRQAPVTIVYYKGPGFRIEVANKAALEMWGKTEEELLGKQLFDVAPELRPVQEPLLTKVWETGTPYIGKEIPVQYIKNGTPYSGYFDFVYQATRNAENEISGIITIGTDVTNSVEARQKVADSEKRYHMMMMDSPFAFAIFKGRDMVIELANDSMKKILGKGNDVEGKPLLVVLPELAGQPFPKFLDDVYNTGQPFYANEALARLHRNGKLEDAYFNFVYQPFREVDGRIVGITVIAYEVTNEVMANKRIAANEQNVRNLFSQTPIGIAVYRGPDHIVELANETMLGYWRRSKEEAIGKPLWEVVPEGKDQGLDKILAHVYSTGEPFVSPESPVIFEEDGKKRVYYFQFGLRPLKEEDGRTTGVLGIATDVTDQVAMQKQTEENQRQLNELANAMPQLVWIAEPSGQVFYYNDRVAEFAGATRRADGRWEWEGLVHPDDLQATHDAWNNAVADRKAYEKEHRIKLKDGNYRWFLSRAYPQKNAEGEVVKWFGTATDIDDRRLHESRKDDFIKMASHELKTPITVIKAYFQLLQGKITESGEAVLQQSSLIIDRQINKLTKLIAELLDVTRIESGRLVLEKSVFGINDLVSQVIEDMRTLSKKHSINLRQVPTIQVNADKERVEQVVINLLGNAIKYSPQANEINITITHEQPMVVIGIQDFGIGIKPSEHGKIYDNFYRVKGKDEQTFPGFGIGLYVVKEIIKAHGGDVWVNSAENSGSTFYFSLPVHHALN